MERMTRQAVAAVEREEGGKNTGTPEINTEGQKAQTNRHMDTQTQKTHRHTDRP